MILIHFIRKISILILLYLHDMKKFFKKHTPDRDVIKNNKYFSFLGNSLFHKDLWKFNRESFCRATAIGLFLGWMPMIFQMIP